MEVKSRTHVSSEMKWTAFSDGKKAGNAVQQTPTSGLSMKKGSSGLNAYLLLWSRRRACVLAMQLRKCIIPSRPV
eukprot:356295-Pelagomonas_calceolata.AAC.2